MKDINQITRLIKYGENESVEFKSKWVDSRTLKRLMIAFANTKGGHIIFGISDNGQINGLEKSDKQEERIKEIAKNECNPSIDYEFYYVAIEDKTIAIIEIKKSRKTHSTNENEIYIRSGASTPKLLQTTLSNGTKVFTEYGNTSYLIDFNVPDNLHPGQEKVIESLKIAEHKNTLKIKFHWGDDSIKVVGAHMIEPNIFEFPASDKITSWYLKFCASEMIRIECDKEVYISVEEIFRNERIVKFSKFLSYFLIGISFLPLIFSTIDFFTSETEKLKLIYGPISIPLPIVTILSFIILNKRISVVIDRLANIKLTTNSKYIEKAISDPKSILLKVLKIRYNEEYQRNTPHNKGYMQ